MLNPSPHSGQVRLAAEGMVFHGRSVRTRFRTWSITSNLLPRHTLSGNSVNGSGHLFGVIAQCSIWITSLVWSGHLFGVILPQKHGSGWPGGSGMLRL